MIFRQIEPLFEDNHLIIVNKRPGELVQGDSTGDMPLVEGVKLYIKEKYNKPGAVFCGVTHRIDRPTSGIVVFAKTSKALERVNEMFREKLIKKTYWAVVKNKPPQQSERLVHFLQKNAKTNKAIVSKVAKKDFKEAILTYTLIASSDRYHLLNIDLETGRHHQIRAQLSAIGCPIKGDLKYGFDRSNPDGSIHLHARSIAFEHPVKKEPVFITAPAPTENLWQSFEHML